MTLTDCCGSWVHVTPSCKKNSRLSLVRKKNELDYHFARFCHQPALLLFPDTRFQLENSHRLFQATGSCISFKMFRSFVCLFVCLLIFFFSFFFCSLAFFSHHRTRFCRIWKLTPQQYELCVQYKEYMPSMGYAAREAIKHCRSQFQFRKWNCTIPGRYPLFERLENISK